MEIASLRLSPWMACMQKMQEHFSVAMTTLLGRSIITIHLYITGLPRVSHNKCLAAATVVPAYPFAYQPLST
jgi:hypothetical protein